MSRETGRYHRAAMERRTDPTTGPTAPAGLAESRLWWLVFVAVCAWQAWLTLSLFGSPPPTDEADDRWAAQVAAEAGVSWERLISDEPIASGRHPLHLYFGYLGAQSFRERGTVCCYDPAFQAGYPKTPVFDSGSRPAELFLYLAGSEYRPRAYKLGLAVCLLLVPFFLFVAARAAGLTRAAACLAIALGLVVGWGTPGRAALEAGDVDLMLGGVASVTFTGLLLAFHRAPHFGNWLGLLLVGCVGWFAHPFLWLLLVPLLLVYYLSIGARHQLGWHVALFATLAVPLVVNAFWLVDWLRYWWIRLPLQLGTISLKHRTFQTVWTCPLWGDVGDRALGVALLLLAVAGVVMLNQSRQRVAARLLGLGAGGLFALTVVGLAWEPVGKLGAVQLLTAALWFATLPAVYVLQAASRQTVRRLGAGWKLGTAALAAGLVVAACVPWSLGPWFSRWARLQPLSLGLTPECRDLVELLRARTTGEARILWEDLPGDAQRSRWSVLLPVLTERAYVGGLAPDGCIEHAYAGIVDQVLLGRHIATWSDAELADYCRRYNVGWVVAWSPAVVKRFRDWQGESAGAPIRDEKAGVLFDVGRSSLVLRGQARVLCANRERIALADVVPDADGVVVLSLHYQAELTALPSRVQVEREPDPFDPIPLLRLRVPGPTPLITISWDDRK